jgi:HK97 family phage portal protein
MNPITSATKALASGLGQFLTSLRTMRHPGQPIQWSSLLKRTRFDYRREVGDGLDSSVVTAPVFWVQRSLPEATLALEFTNEDGAKEDLDSHEMLDLIQTPNRFYGDIALWMATILSFLVDGNAYWIKVRNGYGKPTELWWVPWWMIEPKAPIDGSDFIEYYEYTPGTGLGRMPLDPQDVVHFRHGINPKNLMKGISPLDGVIREIFTDLEASNFVASLLRNMGVPGVIISPKGGAMPASEDVEATKTWFKQAFGGDNRGGPLVMGAPTDVSSYGFDPKAMDLSEGRDVAEERVCAVIGVPAAVVGFGAGLQQTKVGATMKELRELAWQNGVLPYAKMLADELQRSLLPDFQRGAARKQKLRLYWNTENVVALQEDENKRTERKLKEFDSGAITLFDYLSETGRDAGDEHKYYLRPFNKVVVWPEQMKPAQLGHNGGPALDDDGDGPWCGECGAELDDGTCPNCDDDDPEPDPGQKSLPPPETKNSPDWVPADATDASEEAIRRGMLFVEQLQREENALSEAFEAQLRPLFESWGDEAGKAAERVLINRGEKAGKPIETKATISELVQAILDLLNIEAWDSQLSARYQTQYFAVAKQVAASIEASGFATGIPDPVMREVIAQGGKRAGLIDLDEQTKAALFKALTEGRAEGEGVTALANRIANMVEGGPRLNAEQRAKMIARTETKHAQNVSTIAGARANGVMQMVTFDGIFGEPRSELAHIARSGKIVSIEAAQLMTDNMRPNCTLSFSPHFDF